jgi:serine/threonine protein kinase
VWKVADFGISTEGTSITALKTTQSRGTDGYRAPELIHEGRYSNKVDIWALGCILYLLATGKSPFFRDWDVLKYSYHPNMALFELPGKPAEWGAVIDLITLMLSTEPSRRPAATAIYETFKLFEDRQTRRIGRIPFQQPV